MIVAGAIIGTFYTVGHDAWQAHEYYYEGAFCLFASLVISIMGVALLRIGTLQDKWRVKLAKAMEAPIKIKTGQGWFKQSMEKYAMFILPFITVLREGIEAIIFVSGVSFSAPATAIPLPVVIGLIAGGVAGYIIYRQVKTGAMAACYKPTANLDTSLGEESRPAFRFSSSFRPASCTLSRPVSSHEVSGSSRLRSGTS